MGGNCLLKLNIDSRPIANKYREGKVKRTLERELKVPEIAEKEANETSFLTQDCCGLTGSVFSSPQGEVALLKGTSIVLLATSSQCRVGAQGHAPRLRNLLLWFSSLGCYLCLALGMRSVVLFVIIWANESLAS